MANWLNSATSKIIEGQALMFKPSLFFGTLTPALAVGMVLIALCLTAGIALAADAIRFPYWGTAAVRLAWTGIILGLIFACAGIALAVQTGGTFQRSFEETSRRVHVAAERLGCRVFNERSDTNELIANLHELLTAIDRVMDERSQREREVLRADQLAMVGQIAAGVAHEIRNPLTSIKLLIQTNLRESSREGVPVNDLQIMDQEIRRMEKCLQQFLDFARPPRPERRPIDLAILAERTLALVDGRARKQRVTLEFQPLGSPVVVEADEDQIQQLLVNLVLNALDAMPDGGRIKIQLSRLIDGQVEVRVIDTGPGIPPDLFAHLFDPFVSTKETGIGLGLAVSHRIAARHGGSLSAENLETQGACFILRLPVSQAPPVSVAVC